MRLNAQELAEVRAAHVNNLARDHFVSRRAAVIAGDSIATRDVSNELLEQLANGGELKGLIVSALNSPAELTGRAFAKAVVAVIQRQAEEDAEAQVAAAEHEATTEKMQV